ncbi:putative disease resistance protein RGA3 [Cannabis sativa]|uniref:putative disease resistance protein RGA3 n=1 Tax=Cannabis sativa TaxID=3483 RepID=UPI0029CA988D|nr:putative disease resistance protein RGA3 [Cannabis sativa]
MAAANFNLTVVAGRILKLLGSEEEHIAQNEMLMGLKEIIEEHALVLLHAENMCLQGDEVVRSWMMKLEDALCDAENLVDELTSTGNVMAINHLIPNCFISPHTPKMSNNKEVNRVRRRLEQLAFEGRDFHLDKLSEKQVGTMKPDINHAAVVQEEFFLSRADDKAAILKFVSNPNQSDQVNVEVLPIIGKAGIGKTALAKEVFNDEMVRDHFELRIWVSVGVVFDLIQILTTILAHATNRAIEDLEFEVLAYALKGKLYLIVLDDAWHVDTEEWDVLRNILRVGAHGSKIIVTTRNEEVAKITGTMAAYSLNMPSEEQSWLLFRKMAFKEEEEEPSERSYQKEIGREIVKMCRGDPVVIMMLESLLRTSSSEEEWRSFYQNELQPIRNEGLLGLMVLCYKHLPSTLKHCFAYCSLFPEDHEYDVQTVIKLWMSQGFIIESLTGQDQSPEDAGYDYVLELLRRGFFQVSQIDTRDRVIKFEIHYLVRRLLEMVAEDHCRMLKSCILPGIHVFMNQEIEVRNMRSMVVPFQSLQWIRGYQLLDITVSRFIFIRTLDMHGLGINRVPSSITNLKLLKYLDLSENEDITELPHSITKLLNLQTLKLSSCYRLKRLPRRGFENLINLRHLEIDGCYNLTSLPRGIHQLTNLQILSQLAVSDQGTSPNIGFNAFTKEVDIKNLGHEKFDMSSYLNVVSGVQSLSLKWESNAPESNEHKTPLQSELLLALKELTLLGFRGNILFSANCPSNLVKLSLRKCVNCSSLPALEGLWNLKVLVLDELIKLEYISKNENASSVATPFFPSLKELWLTELPKLQSWWRNEGMNVDVLPSFPCLSKLVIEDCPKLTSIPLFPTLEEGLALDSTCWKPFQLTLNKKTAPQEASSSSSSPSSLPLSNLKALRIVGIENFYGDEIEWRTLKSLEFLRFDSLPNLVSLPEGLQHVVSLKEFQLWRCGTEEIPEWIGKLHNLSKLMICLCPNLKSLPESIRELKLLETLEIEECNTLLRRCEKEIGADWEKICLIKNLRLGRIYDK